MKHISVDNLILLNDLEYASHLYGLIDSAHRRIWASLFSVNPNPMEDSSLIVRSLIQRLARAVDRGVDVRVIVGGHGGSIASTPPGNDEAVGMMGALGIDARVHVDAGLHGSHAKYVLVDEQHSLVGSHHWSPRSLGVGGDMTVAAVCPNLNLALGRQFVQQWQGSLPRQVLPLGVPRATLRTSDWKWLPPVAVPASDKRTTPLGSAWAELLTDSRYLPAVLKAIAGAKERIDVSMFYFSESRSKIHPTTRLRAALIAAHRRGVKVTVMLDTDDGTTKYGSQKINSQTLTLLRKAGIAARFDSAKKVNHLKVVVIDGAQVFIGSHNWTGNSLTALHEVSLRVDSSALAAAVRRRIDRGAATKAKAGRAPRGRRAIAMA